MKQPPPQTRGLHLNKLIHKPQQHAQTQQPQTINPEKLKILQDSANKMVVNKGRDLSATKKYYNLRKR